MVSVNLGQAKEQLTDEQVQEQIDKAGELEENDPAAAVEILEALLKCLKAPQKEYKLQVYNSLQQSYSVLFDVAGQEEAGDDEAK